MPRPAADWGGAWLPVDTHASHGAFNCHCKLRELAAPKAPIAETTGPFPPHGAEAENEYGTPGPGRAAGPIAHRATRIPPRPARCAIGRRRSVDERERNPGFRESAQPMPSEVTAHRGSAQSRAPLRAIGPGLSHSVRGRQGFAWNDAAQHVKKWPQRRVDACTVHRPGSTSSQVRALVDWKRAPRPCFDPWHRGGRGTAPGSGSRTPAARPSSVPRRGPLSPL